MKLLGFLLAHSELQKYYHTETCLSLKKKQKPNHTTPPPPPETTIYTGEREYQQALKQEKQETGTYLPH